MKSEKGIEKTEVTGVGVGVPGPVVKERFFSSDRTIAQYNEDIWKLK